MQVTRLHEIHGLASRFAQQGIKSLSKGGNVTTGPEEGTATFESVMRQNAMEWDAYDLDQNRMLDFREYSKMVREREVGIFPEAILHYRFNELDPQGTGYVHLRAFLVQSLRDALTRSAARVSDVLAHWDEDGDGELTKQEFRKALRAMGFRARNEEFDAIFDEFDTDNSGTISSAELSRMLRIPMPAPQSKGQRGIAMMAKRQHSLRREYEDERVAPALKNAQIDPNMAGDVQEQLVKLLERSKTRVIDLFRAWDDDFSGTIDKKEFRRAIRSLGVQCTKQQIDDMFDVFDIDGSGCIDYHELNRHLRRQVELDGILQAGAAGKIELEAKNKFALGKSFSSSTRSKTLSGTKLSVDASMPLAEQLSAALKKNHARVSDLFKEWDLSEDGSISKWEWRLAMQTLGLTEGESDGLREAADALFDQIDVDRSGSVEVSELFRAIDPTQVVVADRRKSFSESKIKRITGSTALEPQIKGGWCPRQRLLERPLCDLMGHPQWDPISRTFSFSGGLLPELRSRLVTARPQVEAVPKALDTSAMRPSPKVSSLPPPPVGWTPFQRPPRKPQRPAMRLDAIPKGAGSLSVLQSSSKALRRSLSASALLMSERAEDLQWFQASLSKGDLPPVASVGALGPVRVHWTQEV